MDQLPLDPSKSLQLSPSEDLATALLQEDADDGGEGPLFTMSPFSIFMKHTY